MSDIKVERKPNDERLDSQEVKSWPIWTKEKSEFPWTYDEKEVCYFLEGDVVVTPEGGEPVEVGVGDLVTTCFSRHSRNRHVGDLGRWLASPI